MYAFGSNSMKRCFVPLQLERIVKFLSTLFASHSIMYIEFMSFESLRSSKTPLALVTMEVSLLFMLGQNMFLKVINIFECFFTIPTFSPLPLKNSDIFYGRLLTPIYLGFLAEKPMSSRVNKLQITYI